MLYSPRDLIDAHQLECWTFELTLVMHNELDNTLHLAHIITGEYVASYITLLYQKVILLRNVLPGVNLVTNEILLRYVMCYISNALLLAVK